MPSLCAPEAALTARPWPPPVPLASGPAPVYSRPVHSVSPPAGDAAASCALTPSLIAVLRHPLLCCLSACLVAPQRGDTPHWAVVSTLQSPGCRFSGQREPGVRILGARCVLICCFVLSTSPDLINALPGVLCLQVELYRWWVVSLVLAGRFAALSSFGWPFRRWYLGPPLSEDQTFQYDS